MVPPYAQAWTFRAPKGALSGAVILDDPTEGRSAITVGEDAVYALDLDSGDLSWRIDRELGPLSMPAIGTLGGRSLLVFVEGGASPASGTSTASPSISPAPSAAPTPSGSGSEGTATTVQLVGVDLATRERMWSVPLRAAVRAGVAIDGTMAFTGDEQGNVYAVDVDGGSLAWTAKVGGRIDAAPAVHDGKVYVVARDSEAPRAGLVAFDEATGDQAWSFDPGVAADTASAPAAGAGVALVGTADRFFRSLDAQTGDVRWESLLTSVVSPVSSAASTPVGVFVADASGGLYLLDPRNGARTWGFQFNEYVVRSSPVVLGDVVLLGTNDGRLVCVSVSSGNLVWESERTPGLVGAIAASPMRIVVVKGGKTPGLVAFAADPEGTLIDVPSPTEPDPARIVGYFAVGSAIALALILVPGMLLARRFGTTPFVPADGSEHEDDEDGEPT